MGMILALVTSTMDQAIAISVMPHAICQRQRVCALFVAYSVVPPGIHHCDGRHESTHGHRRISWSGSGAIIALTFTLVADLSSPSELPPNRVWTIFQPNGDREDHDRSHELP
jgi:hypothetical protein